MSVCGGGGRQTKSESLTTIALSGWAVVTTSIAITVVTTVALVRGVVGILCTVSAIQVSGFVESREIEAGTYPYYEMLVNCTELTDWTSQVL